jgi:hypothetical protein
MALLAAPTAIPEPGGIKLTEGPVSWIADNTKKKISRKTPSVTIHASADFSRLHWGTPADGVAEILLQNAADWLHSEVRAFQLHRWQYSQPIEIHPSPCIKVDGDAPLVFAGDAFGGPRVEGAALSGLAAAEALLAVE